MEALQVEAKKLCLEACQDEPARANCDKVCSRASAAAAALRGKLFNVPFPQTREGGLDGGGSELAWAATDPTFAKSAWLPASDGADPRRSLATSASARAGPSGGGALPPGAFRGWGQVPNLLLPPPRFTADAPLMRRESAEATPLAGYLLPYDQRENAPAWPHAASAAGAAVDGAAQIGFGLSRGAIAESFAAPGGARRRPPNLAA
jgi:hypothetical protein